MGNTIELKVVATYHFDGKWNIFEKMLAKSVFNEYRNSWVPLFNANIDKVNKDWDKDHPDKTKIDPNTGMEVEYLNFVRKEMMPMMDVFNIAHLSHVFEGTLTDECEFALINEKGGTVCCSYRAV